MENLVCRSRPDEVVIEVMQASWHCHPSTPGHVVECHGLLVGIAEIMEEVAAENPIDYE